MRILLVRAPLSFTAYEPPLGVMYLAAYLRKNGYSDISICDIELPKNYATFDRRLQELKPDLVGISAISYNFDKAYEIAKKCKQQGAAVVVGGPHFTFVDVDSLRLNKDIDAVVRGEGEETFLEYVKRLDTGKGFEGLLGLTFRKKGRIVRNPDRPFIPDIDSIPYPAWDLVDMNSYQYLGVLASRGCPFRCIYCSSPNFWKRKLRARSPKSVVDEIEELVKRYGADNILHIKDDTFTARKKWAMDICDEILNRNLKIKWECLGRVNTVDSELLKKLKSAGCQIIEYGIESGNPDILRVIKKDITLEQVERAIKLTHDVGLKAGSFFMLGHPQETRETIEDTFNFSLKIRPDTVDYCPCDIFPGTELEVIAKESSVLRKSFIWEVPKNKSGYKERALVPPYSTPELPRGVLEEYSRRFKMRFALCRVFSLNSVWDVHYLLSEYIPTHFMINSKEMLNYLLQEIVYSFRRSENTPKKLLGSILLPVFLLVILLKHLSIKLARNIGILWPSN